ncbi:MAG: hypothetical protein KDA65_00075 [Planctomycetaceae bacterium]|nr:hypothetical protein [Planctomycetaceae bacterium]
MSAHILPLFPGGVQDRPKESGTKSALVSGDQLRQPVGFAYTHSRFATLTSRSAPRHNPARGIAIEIHICSE